MSMTKSQTLSRDEVQASMQTIIGDNIQRVREEISAACKKSGRATSDVRLIAATKFVDCERILAALHGGITDIGENRAQELTEKLNFYKLHGCCCHYIGQLQSNKVKYVCGNVDYIHSVDRLPLAREISNRATRMGIVQKLLLQVNIACEPQKGGVSPTAARTLLDDVAKLTGVSVCGLMSVPPIGTAQESRTYFAALRVLLASLQAEYPQLPLIECSMGMSDDFAVAIEEGATMVRVGTRIFGERILIRQ